MFKLTKFTGEEFYLNPETIKSVEEGGDTVVCLITGERYLVKETAEEISKRFLRYKQAIHGKAHEGQEYAPGHQESVQALTR